MKKGILPLFFAGFGVPLTFGLGVWQVQRHMVKMDAHELVHERISAPKLSNEALIEPKEEDHWKLIDITGSYTQKTALIGGKMEQRQPGYQMLHLFETDSGTPIIVERGWMPREDINKNHEMAMENIESITVTGQLRPIRFFHEMEPAPAPDFPAEVWRPGSQGEIHRRWLPDAPTIYITEGPVLREHQSKDLTQMPYRGFVPTPAEYNSFYYAIQWFVISMVLLGIGIKLGLSPEPTTPES